MIDKKIILDFSGIIFFVLLYIELILSGPFLSKRRSFQLVRNLSLTYMAENEGFWAPLLSAGLPD